MGEVIRWIAVVLTLPRFWALRDEWQDLHQEVLTRVIESLRRGRFDDSRSFRAYVQGIARLTSLQALSQRLNRRVRAVGWEPTTEPEAEAGILHRQLARRVLDLATEECRGLIREHFFDERSHADMAASRGVPVGTIKSRLFRCLEKAHREMFRIRRKARHRVSVKAASSSRITRNPDPRKAE